jgi:N-methylhydantoinase B
MSLNTEPGGEGKYSGGRGIVMDYRIRAEDGYLTAGYTRSKFPAWSLDGGNEGSSNYVEYLPQNGKSERFAFVSGLNLSKNDVIRVVTGNGGGLGDPKSRSKELIKDDLKNELITPEVARDVYGMMDA